MFKFPFQRISVAKFHTSPLIREAMTSIKENPVELWETSRSKLITYIESNKNISSQLQIPQNDFSKILRIYWSYMPSAPVSQKHLSILSSIGSEDFTLFTKERWQISPMVRSLFMRELIFNCNNIQLVNKLITLLGVKLPIPEISTSLDVLKWCINVSLKKSDVITAIDLYVLYYRTNIDLLPNWEYAHKLISSLKYQHPKYDNIHLKRLIEVIQLLKKHNISISLSTFDIQLFCNKALSPDADPLTSKTILSMLLDSQLKFKELKSRTHSENGISTASKNQLEIGYSLINKDYKIRNQTGIYLAWIQIKDIYSSFSDHDSRILYKVFESSSHNRAYRDVCVEMLEKMKPSSYCNDPLLILAIIKYVSITKSLKKAQTLMDNLEKYTTVENKKIIWSSRRFLSSLLRMQLTYFEAESVDKIITQITEIYGSLSATDYEAIVSYLLGRASMTNIKRALQFVDSIPLGQRLSSYIILLNKLIESIFSRGPTMTPLVMPLINEILVTAHEQDPEHTSRIWTVVAALYIKTILFPITSKRMKFSPNVDTSSLDLAKLLYCKNLENHIPSSEITLNPFIEAHPHDINLKLTKTNRLIILRNIAYTSLKCSRRDIFRWSCTQLYKEGMLIEELIFLWNFTFKHQFRRTNYHSKSEIKYQLDKHGIKAFDKLLQ